MITPGFSPTATERVLPKLALDFTTASLDSRITFTRALDTATRVNSSGLIETVLANTPRFDYTLNTGGACKGLLIEEARTNLIVGSAGSGGTKIGTATITLNNATAPNGLTEATLISGIAVGAANGIRFRVAGTTAGNYTCSIYIKATANSIGKDMRVYFEGNGGVYQSFGTLDTTLTGSWQRISITGNSAGTSTYLDFVCSRGGSAQADEYYIWGAQMEAGAFATSIIPTTSGTVLRNADVATMTGTNFSSWYNASQGTISVLAMSPQSGQVTTQLINISDGTTSNRMWIDRLTANDVRFIIQNSGSTVGVVGGATIANGVTFNANAAYKLDNLALCVSNGNLGFDTSSTIPTVNNITIGYGLNSNFFCGYIKRILYWPMRLTDNEVKTYSKV